MAVTFTERSFIIEVETPDSPIEEWLKTHEQLLDILQCVEPGMRGDQYCYLNLLSSMQPSIEFANRMLTRKP